jgi:hypothetical protein
MRLIYVAGKFTAPTREGVQQNIRHAETVGLEVCKLGLFPVVPHCNTSHANYESLQPYTFWIEGTLELLRRCDAIVMVPGWEESRGAKGELLEAQRIGLPVFLTLEALAESIGHRSNPLHSVPPGEDRPTEPCPPPDDVEARGMLETLPDVGKAAE